MNDTSPIPTIETAADAHDEMLYVDHSRLAPRFEDPVVRPVAIEALDVRPEKASCAPPGPSTEHVARRRHEQPRVQAPALAPEEAGRNVEVESGHATGGPKHPGHLSQGRARIGHVAQQVAE